MKKLIMMMVLLGLTGLWDFAVSSIFPSFEGNVSAIAQDDSDDEEPMPDDEAPDPDDSEDPYPDPDEEPMPDDE